MKFVLLFAILALAAAEPGIYDEDDALVPEVSLVDDLAFSFVQSQLASKGGTECTKMAMDSQASVQYAASDLQSELDNFGEDKACANKGQSAVDQAAAELAAANQDKVKIDAALVTAKATSVNFGDIPFSSLAKPSCTNFWENPAYTAVATTVANAEAAATTAANRVSNANTGVKTSNDNQQALQKNCYCKAKDDHKALLDSLSTKLVTEQTKTWAQAAQLLCAVANKTSTSCVVPALPTLTQGSLGAEAVATTCSLFIGYANMATNSGSTVANQGLQCAAKYPGSVFCTKRDIVDYPSLMSDSYNIVADFKDGRFLCSFISGGQWTKTWDYRCLGQQATCCKYA